LHNATRLALILLFCTMNFVMYPNTLWAWDENDNTQGLRPLAKVVLDDW
jgi:hypothetical protein